MKGQWWIMTSELKLLGLSVGLGLLHIVLASHAASIQKGYRWTAGPRDEPEEPLVGVAGRLARASRNFGETFPFFAAAVLANHVAGSRSDLSLYGAHLYLWARIAYLPIYVAGTYLIRSLVWNVAFVGIALNLVAPLGELASWIG